MTEQKIQSPLGLWSLIALTIGNMIGSGLYVSSAFAISDLRDARIVIGVWGAGALLAFCGAVCYRGLAKRIPVSGGEYSFVSTIFGNSVGWVAGFISLTAGFTLPISASALVVGEFFYTDIQTTPNSWLVFNEQTITASVCIAIASVLLLLGFRMGSTVQNTVVTIKLGLLLLLLVAGFGTGMTKGWYSGQIEPFPEASSISNTYEATAYGWSMVFAFGSSLYFIALAYTGYNAPIYIAGAYKNGDSILGKAMLMSVAIVSVFYILLNAMCLFILPAEQIAGNTVFFAKVARYIGGSVFEWAIRAAIITSALSSVVAMLITAPFVYRKMLRDAFSSQHQKFESMTAEQRLPRVEILIQAVLAIILVHLISLQSMLAALGLTLTCCAMLAFAGLWWMTYSRPEIVRLRWYEHCAAGCFTGVTICMLAIGLQIRSQEFWVAIGFLGFAVLLKIASWLFISTMKPTNLNRS